MSRVVTHVALAAVVAALVWWLAEALVDPEAHARRQAAEDASEGEAAAFAMDGAHDHGPEPAGLADAGDALAAPAGRPARGPFRRVDPGAEQLRELRRRVAEAAGIARRAAAGDAAAATEQGERLAAEPDPRVRHALATGEEPTSGARQRGSPPLLPPPAAAADPGTVNAYWLTPGHHDGTYQSAIAIAGDGRAVVETVFEPPDGQRWRVRYAGWAYRDAAGRLVVDARGQPVEYLERPPWGLWSPDSMVIGRDGLIELIDDKHDPGSGTRGAAGDG